MINEIDIKDYKEDGASQPSANDKQVGGSHYKNMRIEPWDIVDTWPVAEQIAVYRHGVLKYLMRMGTKDENVLEIEKGLHYIEKLLEVLKGRK